MGKVYIDNWIGFKIKSDPRRIGVHIEWNLTNKKVQLKNASNASLSGEVLFEYEIFSDSFTGSAKTTDYVYLNVNSDDVPVGHMIKIKSYENNEEKDDVSMQTSDAPTL